MDKVPGYIFKNNIYSNTQYNSEYKDISCLNNLVEAVDEVSAKYE